ncbi:MAG: branched-chain amino acid ABC transporter permease, partial [Vicinamibacterales bacterium]
MTTHVETIPQLRTRASAPLSGALARSAFPLAVGLALAFGAEFGAAGLIGDFAARLVMDAGIAIVVAVSLNIVNGLTGQFSLGHA